MHADSEGDEGLELSEDSSLTLALNASDDDVVDGLVVVAAGLVMDEHAVAEELAGGIGGQSRVSKPTNFVNVDGDGGVGIMALEELPIALVPPLQFTTQQSAEGAVFNAPINDTQQSAEGVFATAPLYQPRFGQTLFMPDMTRPQQEL
jgi:hypothetical protein